MGKYTIAAMPASLHEKCPKVPGKQNVLSLGMEQARVLSDDDPSKLTFAAGTKWRSVKCCTCGKDILPTRMVIFQKVMANAIDLTKLKPGMIFKSLDDFQGWRFAGLIENALGYSYSVN